MAAAETTGPQDRIRYVGASKVSVGRFAYGDQKLSIRHWGGGQTLFDL